MGRFCEKKKKREREREGGSRQKRTTIVSMTSFYCLKTYKEGGGCLKITKFERTYFMDGPLLQILNSVLFDYVKANALATYCKKISSSLNFLNFYLTLKIFSDFFRTSYKLSSFLKLFPTHSRKKRKNQLHFYFYAFLQCLKRFYEALKVFIKPFEVLQKKRENENLS